MTPALFSIQHKCRGGELLEKDQLHLALPLWSTWKLFNSRCRSVGKRQEIHIRWSYIVAKWMGKTVFPLLITTYMFILHRNWRFQLAWIKCTHSLIKRKKKKKTSLESSASSRSFACVSIVLTYIVHVSTLAWSEWKSDSTCYWNQKWFL